MSVTTETVSSIGYHELVRRIQHGDRKARIPLQGSWELTYRCNLACTHCWVNLPADDRAARQRELTFEEICRITDEVVEAGALWMLLTGGEVFMRPDFFDIYRYMKRRGLLLTIFTNGTLITPGVADLLAEYPPNRVEVSLYGITPETYEAVTQVPALERCLRGIRLLRERGIKLKLKSVVTTANFDEFLAIAGYVRREFGLTFAYDPNINFRKVEGREGYAPASVRVPPEKVVELDLALDAETGELKKFYERDQRFVTDRVFTCGAGMDTFHIDPYGWLSTCMMVPSHAYDLKVGSFREGWEEFFPAVVTRKKTTETCCNSCAIAAACDACPGWSTLEHGGFERPVEYLCEINHLRAEAFGSSALIPVISPKGVPHG